MRVENSTGRTIQVLVKPRFGGAIIESSQLVNGGAAVCRNVPVAALEGDLDDLLTVSMETRQVQGERRFERDDGGVGSGVPEDDGDGDGVQGGVEIFNRTDVEVRFVEFDEQGGSIRSDTLAFGERLVVAAVHVELALSVAAAGDAVELEIRKVILS